MSLDESHRDAGEKEPPTFSPRVAIIREEFLTLTRNPLIAALLNQLVYWSQRTKDFDQYLNEECEGKKDAPPQYGWFYKTTKELLKEAMLDVDPKTLRRYRGFLVSRGWIDFRPNPKNTWNKTGQYRVNLRRISFDLQKRGLTIPGFTIPLETSFSFPEQPLSHTTTADQEERSDNTHPSPNGSSSDCKDVPSPDAPSVSTELKKSSNSREGQNASLDGDKMPASIGTKCPHRMAHSDPKMAANPGKSSWGQNVPLDRDKMPASIGTKCPHRMGKNAPSNTENTTENTNREKAARAGADAPAREAPQKNRNQVEKGIGVGGDGGGVSILGGVPGSENPQNLVPVAGSEGKPTSRASSVSSSVSNSLSETQFELMEQALRIWKRVFGQEIEPSAGLERKLSGFLSSFCKGDLSRWESLCVRASETPFLNGGGKRGWRMTLAWLLESQNAQKVLEGNYDDPETLAERRQKLERETLDQQKIGVLESIPDPLWKDWCTRLVQGTSYEPSRVTLSELKTLSKASFAEFDGRLVWIHCPDKTTLHCVESYRFPLITIAQSRFPKTRSIRTEIKTPSLPPQQKGISHE